MYNTISSNEKEIKGGCRGLIEYLDKEETLSQRFIKYLDKESQFAFEEKLYFFNGLDKEIENETVINAIDNNRKGLSREDAYFYSLTIDPSKEEIKHIYDTYVLPISEALSQSGAPGDIEQIKDGVMRRYLTDYAVKSMDLYAQNFGRKGVKSNKDLVWFGRVEKDRYWKENSREVRHNKKIYDRISRLMLKPSTPKIEKNIERLRSDLILESDVREGGKPEPIQAMMRKSGDNYHIHVIVSRKDKTQKIKLSPLAKARENEEHKVGGRECKIGFDRNKFTIGLEKLYDSQYFYDRPLEERYEFRKEQCKSKELEDRISKEHITSQESKGHAILGNQDEYAILQEICKENKVRKEKNQNWEMTFPDSDGVMTTFIPYYIDYEDFDPFEDIPIVGYMTKEEYRLYTTDRLEFDKWERNKSIMETCRLTMRKDVENKDGLVYAKGIFSPKVRTFDSDIQIPDNVRSSFPCDNGKVEFFGDFLKRSLREILPYCKTMDDFFSLLRDRQILSQTYIDKKGRKNLEFTMKDLGYSDSLEGFKKGLSYKDIKDYVEHGIVGEPIIRFEDTLMGRTIFYRKCLEKVNEELEVKSMDNMVIGLREYGITLDLETFTMTNGQEQEPISWNDIYDGYSSDHVHYAKFVGDSLNEVLPYCKNMDDLMDMLRERGIIAKVHANVSRHDIHFSIEGVSCDPLRLKDISDNLRYQELIDYIGSSRKGLIIEFDKPDVKTPKSINPKPIKREQKQFFRDKIQGFNGPTVSRPETVLFDLTLYQDRGAQVKFVRESLREVLPYCNTMAELEGMLREREVIADTFKNENGNQDMCFFIFGATSDPILLCDLSSELHYHEVKDYIERDGRIYYFQDKVPYSDNLVKSRPESIRFEDTQDGRAVFYKDCVYKVYKERDIKSFDDLAIGLREHGITLEQRDGTFYLTNREGQEPMRLDGIYGDDFIDQRIPCARFLGNSLHEMLPYCNSMNDLAVMLRDRGVTMKIDKNDMGYYDLCLSIDGVSHEPLWVGELPGSPRYGELKNYIGKENRKHFLLDKIQQFNGPYVERPEAIRFDPSLGQDYDCQVEFLGNSLRDTLPYCNSMNDLMDMLRERGIKVESLRNDDGYHDLRLSIDGVSQKPLWVGEVSRDFRYYKIKEYVDREWREYYFQDKIQRFNGSYMERPEAVRFDPSLGVDHERLVKFVGNSLHEILPYCNDMEYFREMLAGRGIIVNDCRDGNGFKDFSFNIDGVKDMPVRLQELCGDLGYFDIRNYVENEWRRYFYKEKVQRFDSPSVDRPAAVSFDPSQGLDHARQVKFIENSLRESLPYCNTMAELEGMLKERGIDMITRPDTLLFGLGVGTDDIDLKEISKNLNLYELERYVKREWQEHFYQPKAQKFGSDPVEPPMTVLFDPDQGVDHDRRAKFISFSLREVFPYCNSMGELEGMLKERGIIPEVYRDEKEGTSMRFNIDGVEGPAVSLQDISENLKYYELKFKVEREWQEYFYQPKVQQFGSDPVQRPMAVSFDPAQGTDHARQVKFVESSLREVLPFCNTMGELEGMMRERGIIPEVYRDEDTKIDMRFNIDGLDDVTPIKLEDISDNLQYHKLRNRVESEWKRDYFKEKVQAFDSPLVDRPAAVTFDPSQGLGLDKQVRFVENSLCDSLPYCNTMAELEGMLKERGITAEIFKNEDGYSDLRFTVDGIGSDPVRLQDLSGDLRYYEMKKYIEREWRQYFYQEKVQAFDSPSVDRPAAVSFDPSQGLDHARQVKFIENSLREVLPFCNTMGELEGMMRERGITGETFKNEDGYRDLRFTIEGIGGDPIRFGDLSGDLRYYEVKGYVEREWREYYYQEKVQGFDSPQVDRPAAVSFDPSQGLDHARQVKFVESSLREVLPFCNTMGELEGMMRERGIDLVVGYGEDKRNTLYFNLGGEINIELKELSGDLKYYEVKGYVEREWRQYFYQEKVQSFDSPRVDRPAAVAFDPSQGLDLARQVKFVESSLREVLPFCNTMGELEGMMRERGITGETFKDEDGYRDLRFTIEGIGGDPIRLRDVSENLKYYDLKFYVQKEWNEYFFLPKQQEQDIQYTSFNLGLDATPDVQRTYILETLRNTLPYCDTFSGLKDKLGKQGIDMESSYVRDTGREICFHIQGIHQPVRFKSEELHPNLDYWGMVNYVGKDDLIYQGNQRITYDAALTMAAKKLMYETGLKYIHDSVKPYQQTVSLGVSGLRILASDGLAKDKAALLAKNIASAFGYKMGFAVLEGVAQYVNPYITAMSLLKQGISAGLSGHDR